METQSPDIEPAVPFTHKSDHYRGFINGELLAAKWCSHTDGFVAILKETDPLTGATEIRRTAIPFQDTSAGSVPHESEALQIRVQESTPGDKILTSRLVARSHHNRLRCYMEMTHWLSILVPESRIHELCNIS
ncbi:hypothetical protein [uncultured Rothia sp.]|uniref:hypothetical protein n=1 Tax=uncultured Rothia sp. TaxID=316088 RepID=UPI0028897987|nr:hypothetical protein [uncultured Rothia sp.]